MSQLSNAFSIAALHRARLRMMTESNIAEQRMEDGRTIMLDQTGRVRSILYKSGALVSFYRGYCLVRSVDQLYLFGSDRGIWFILD